jgi:hypothetical protein
MRRKEPKRVVVGPYCDRCDRPIVGPAIEVGLRNRCVSCLLRANVLVNFAIRQQREKEGRNACTTP